MGAYLYQQPQVRFRNIYWVRRQLIFTTFEIYFGAPLFGLTYLVRTWYNPNNK